MTDKPQPPGSRLRLPPGVMLVLRLAITSGLFYLLFSRVDLGLLISILPDLHFGPLLAALIILILRNGISALRWHILLRSKGYPIPILSLTRFYMIGNFFGFFVPTAIGGDVARGFYAYRARVSRRESASSVLVERVLGTAAMMIMALVAMGSDFNDIGDSRMKLLVIIPSIGVLAALLGFYAVNIPVREIALPWKWLNIGLTKVREVVRSIHIYRENPKAMLSALGYSTVYQMLGILTFYLLGRAVADTTPFVVYVMLLPIVWLITLLPISLNGLGLREGSFVFLFHSAGMNNETAIIVSMLFLLLTIIQGAMGGLIFLFDPGRIDAMKKYAQVPRSQLGDVNSGEAGKPTQLRG